MVVLLLCSLLLVVACKAKTASTPFVNESSLVNQPILATRLTIFSVTSFWVKTKWVMDNGTPTANLKKVRIIVTSFGIYQRCNWSLWMGKIIRNQIAWLIIYLCTLWCHIVHIGRIWWWIFVKAQSEWKQQGLESKDLTSYKKHHGILLKIPVQKNYRDMTNL